MAKVKTRQPDLDSLISLVRSLYSLQKLRIQNGNRVLAAFKVSLGQEPSQSEEELAPEAKNVLKQLREDYKKISDMLSKLQLKRNFEGHGLITNYAQYCMVESYIQLEDSEEAHAAHIKDLVTDFPIWKAFFEKVPGCGYQIAAIIISKIDPHKSKYASSMWKFAGLDVGPDGRGRGRYKEHLVPKTYKNAKGEVTETVGISFDPFLKTKLLGVLGPSLLKAAAVTKNGTKKYAEAYYNYKNRLENHPVHKTKTPKHRHNMAIRFMIKRFLVDLYEVWRPLEGLTAHDEYSKAKLGLTHGEDPVSVFLKGE